MEDVEDSSRGRNRNRNINRNNFVTVENQDIGKQDPMVNSQISGDLQIFDF